MRARRPDGKKLVSPPGHQNRFTKRVPQKHSSIGQFVDVAAPFEIRSFEVLRCLSHKGPSFKIRIALEQHNARSDLLTFENCKIRPETLKIIRERLSVKRQDSAMLCPASHLAPLLWGFDPL